MVSRKFIISKLQNLYHCRYWFTGRILKEKMNFFFLIIGGNSQLIYTLNNQNIRMTFKFVFFYVGHYLLKRKKKRPNLT